jgi:undecaprenyl diphosphate synthase
MPGLTKVPSHVGIIMDGNGRWAKAQDLPRTAGHKEGLNAAKRVVKEASRLGIRLLSLYAFSTENWKRAEEEVSFLMRLIQQHLRKEYTFYKENGIRIVHSGGLERLPDFVRSEIFNAMEETKDFTGMAVNLCINYGGRDEVCRAVNRCLDSGKRRIYPEDVSRHLDIPDFPDTDLVIRTGGEQRLSNFLLWQSAYTEFVYSDKLWPDWNGEDLAGALFEYEKRERKFGGVK